MQETVTRMPAANTASALHKNQMSPGHKLVKEKSTKILDTSNLPHFQQSQLNF